MSEHEFTDENRPVVWGYAESDDTEGWTTAVSREDAEENAADMEGGGWIVSGGWISPGKVASYVADMEGLLERMDEVDEVGGCFDHPIFDRLAPGAEDALKSAIAAWAEKYIKVTNWIATGAPIKVAEASK